MADTKISALTALTGASVDTANDVIPVVDTSVTTTKKITVAELKTALNTFSDPMTTRGDVIVRNSSNVSARLAVGSADQVLKSDGTDPAWGTVATGGITNGAVTLAKMADLAQDQFIGRTTASTGVPETATITAAARSVLDDTTVAAMRTTLGAATSDVGAGGIGAMLMMWDSRSVAFSTTSGSTVSGSDLRYPNISSGGAISASGTAATGTWRNISGVTVQGQDFGFFQRIS